MTRLSCGGCGVRQRVTIDVDTGEPSPCPACGPTTWLAFPTLAPQETTVHPYLDQPCTCPICTVRATADPGLERDPDSPEAQPWWNDYGS